MFTVEQIKQAHSNVRSGADFPAYISEVRKLGVTFYETYVADGHTDYYGSNNYMITSTAKYPELAIAGKCDIDQFKADLKAHQHGQTDYLTFIGTCAKLGIEKWAVSIEEMSCTYFDRAGNKVLMEEIPR